MRFIAISSGLLIISLSVMATADNVPPVTVVRTNPSGYQSSSEPLVTYLQADKIIRQNAEIIKLLKDIEKNTKGKYR